MSTASDLDRRLLHSACQLLAGELADRFAEHYAALPAGAKDLVGGELYFPALMAPHIARAMRDRKETT